MFRSAIVRGVHHDILFSHWQSVLLRGVWSRTLCDREPSDMSDTNRVAPVPIYYADLFPGDFVKLCQLAEESSLPTHASGQCRSTCRYMALLLADLMHSTPRDKVCSANLRATATASRLGATSSCHRRDRSRKFSQPPAYADCRQRLCRAEPRSSPMGVS